jgi:NitT/TauT family transport system permease protein
MKKIISRILFLVSVAVVWEAVYALKLFPKLLFPSAGSVFASLFEGIVYGDYLEKTAITLKLILDGFILGVLVAFCLMAFSLINKFFGEIVDNIVTFLNPIPGIAIFPLCILWLGIGRNAMLFIIVHSIAWGLLLNLLAGIKSTPAIYKEVAQNLEISRFQMFKDIYLPATMPYAIAGFKSALSRAWRTAISVEILAGIAANNAGLGWLMTFQRSTIDIPGLFSSIIIIVVIGVFLEDVVFKQLEKITINKWGMAN